MFYSLKNQKDQVKGILVIYLTGILLIYLILAIQHGLLFVPAFNADFNRSTIFLTILMGVLIYAEDFEVIIAFCLSGPAIVYAIAAVASIFLSDDAFFGFVGTITVAMSYFFMAGMGALCINVVSGSIANKFRLIQSNGKNGSEGVFKVIKTPNLSQINPDIDLDRNHSSKQTLGVIIIELIVLASSIVLLFLPMYDYSIDSHLYVFDLGLLQIILILSVSLNALFLLGAIFLGFNKPSLLNNYNSRLIKIQSVYNGIGYFFISIFIPNPSFRVENYVVTSGAGIEFLAFILFFAIFMTPTIMEYLKQDVTASY